MSRKFSIWLPSLLPVQPAQPVLSSRLISGQAKSGSNSSFHHPTALMDIEYQPATRRPVHALLSMYIYSVPVHTLGTTDFPKRPTPNGFLVMPSAIPRRCVPSNQLPPDWVLRRSVRKPAHHLDRLVWTPRLMDAGRLHPPRNHTLFGCCGALTPDISRTNPYLDLGCPAGHS